jgi:hypothetical protein
MSVVPRTARVLAALAVLALIASCSFSRFGYNQADTLAAWMANDYFDLGPQQKDEFDKRFERFYTWHRQQQLPEYAGFMRTASTRFEDGLTREDVFWFVDGMKSRVRLAARQATPDAAALLATLTPAQIEHLQRKWEKSNQKWVKEHKLDGTREERVQATARRTIKQIENWLAQLTPEQEQRVVAMVRSMPEMGHAHYSDRLRRQNEFLDLLNHRAEDRDRFTARVREWVANWERGRSPEYQRQLEAWWQHKANIFTAVDRMLTPQQRTAGVERLNRYAADFTQLARRGTDDSRTAAR